jgi:hypothetical protein
MYSVTVPSAPSKPEKKFLSFLPTSSDLSTRSVSTVILGSEIDLALDALSETFDLFEVESELPFGVVQHDRRSAGKVAV